MDEDITIMVCEWHSKQKIATLAKGDYRMHLKSAKTKVAALKAGAKLLRALAMQCETLAKAKEK